MSISDESNNIEKEIKRVISLAWNAGFSIGSIIALVYQEVDYLSANKPKDEVLVPDVSLEEERGGRDNQIERTVEERRKEMLRQQTLELQKEREFEESLYRLRRY
jgi:hypothetical protein